MLRFGIVGTGRISDWVLKGALQDPRFKAVAVCSRKEETGRAFIEKHPEVFDSNAQVFTSVENMASSPNVDAIYIGTPNSTHLPYTLAGLKGGKHVMCEKPLGLSEKEVQQMVDAARESGCVLMEAMISILNPNFLAAREKIKEISPIRHYTSSYCQYSSKYEALKRGELASAFNPKLGGSALLDIGIYTTYPLISLFGYPKEVKANMIDYPTSEGPVNLQGDVSLGYDGMTANLVFSKATDSFATTEICGEGGNIILDHIHIARKVWFAPHAAPASGRGKEAEPEILSEGLPMDEYYYEFKEFIDVIEQGRKESEINSLEVSLLNSRLMDKISKI